ncbi:hypothetical protein F5Y04DRAFT_277701 [Hypomontagnella monticulosa]|nr:hypothetical protein F5Y04DRAFT_277701 [Hypomontagnella monticulosa]
MAPRFASVFNISVWLLASHVSCGSIAAWWNTRGPSFIMQDDETGNIRYSLCNGNYTPIFPDDKTITAPFMQHPPKKNTSLSAAGWTDDETAWGSIFYMDDNDGIVNALLKCDWSTGRWENTGEFIISNGSPKVAPTSGISVVLLGAMDGYRVFYNDLDGTLQQIGYTRTTTWQHYGVVSHDKASSQAISTTFSDKNISVVRARDDQNMGVSRWYKDNTWHISTFPETLTGNQTTNATEASDIKLNTTDPGFKLAGWDGNPSALAMGIDHKYTRSIFYIGTDKKLHQVGNINYTWRAFPDPKDANAWPEADVAGGALGIASDFGTSSMRLYYMSGGRMVEVNGDGGNWRTATVLASTNTSQPTTSPAAPDATETNPASAGDQSQGGLSDGAKAGISVGVTLGVIAIAGMAFALWFLRRRQRKLDETDAAAASASSEHQYMSPSSAYTGPVSGYSAAGGPPTVSSRDGHSGYTPIQNGYGQHPQNGGYPPQVGYAMSADGYAQPPMATYPQQGGGWTYTGDPNAQQQQQQQYYYQQHPHEMPEQTKPIEMMGEGHYKEVP